MSDKSAESEWRGHAVLLTLKGFVMGWKGSAPNKSWLPFKLLRRGVIAFGGGATKTEAKFVSY